MSQQLSIPAGGGLLSLNLSALPQAMGVQPGGGSPLFTGFSSMMSDAVSESGVLSGAFLPPQGISLPQGATEQLNLDPEQIKQRLLNLAEMLGQQSGVVSEGEGLPAEVMAELAQALKNFAEGEIPELPEELKQKLADSGVVSEEVITFEEGPEQSDSEQSAQSVNVAGESLDDSADLPSENVAEAENTNDQQVLEVSGDDLPGDISSAVNESASVSQGDEASEAVQAALNVPKRNVDAENDEAADQRAESVSAEEEVASVEGESSEVELPAGFDVDPDFASTDVGQDAEQSQAAQESEADSEVPDVDAQVQLNADAEAAKTEEVVVAPVIEPRRSPLAEAARQELNADTVRNKGEQAGQMARSVNSAGSGAGAPTNPVASAPQEAEVDIPQGSRLASQAGSDARPVEGQVQRAVPKAELQPNASAAQVEGASKVVDNQPARPVVANFSLDKFESMLEASQQLMTKAAAGAEKIGDSPFAQRVDSATSSANPVPQSVSQPTQVQKAVADANNLMMPQNVRINTPAWSNALAERAIMVAAQNTNVAQIQLDPPELGSLNIRVQINQDQVSLNFTSPHAHVRDAVEQSLPRLREMFAEQGLALSDSSVSDQQNGNAAQDQMAGDGKNGEPGYFGQSGEGDLPENQAPVRSVSLVDYYA